jgi:4-hydroxythreonine-4-phosphate dehydrogenase
MIARAALECAADALAQGEFQAVVTLPVSKEALAMAGFAYPGQTEFFGSVAERTPLMVLACQVLRVALVTIHVPLERVPSMITRERELQVIEQFHHMLSIDFGIESPRIAVLGLNPHAGERGLLGWQEEHIIGPAIRDAQRIGIAVSGPFAADGFFAHGAWQSYDGVIAQYHDQGLVPLKLLAQEQGVNITAGLPFVRTSPDHGTAYDLVGTGRARYASLLAAIWMAQYLATNRQVRT